MKVYSNIDDFKGVTNPIVTTGTFDGVHLGHQKIIKRLKEVGAKEQGETVLLTFHPHPRMVLFPEHKALKLLSTTDEKISLLQNLGIDHLIIYPFTETFSKLSSVEFIRKILVEKIKTKTLVIGYNHHFGRNREGSFEHLQQFGPKYGFKVEEIAAQDVDHVEVSSTKIRKALMEGNLTVTNAYLGYTYFLSGNVVEGKKLGRKLGYPTANIKVNSEYKLIPADGIYAVSVDYKGARLAGMMSIGMNPTVGGTEKTLEVNIFDFNEQLYGLPLRIYFHQKIRDEIKFSGLEELVKQMDQDKQDVMAILKK